MELNFIQHLILDILLIDDESLIYIYELIDKIGYSIESKELIRKKYKNIEIKFDNVKQGLKDLLLSKFVILLDERGHKIDKYDIDEVLNDTTEWRYWFRITKKGEKFYNKYYNIFWKDN